MSMWPRISILLALLFAIGLRPAAAAPISVDTDAVPTAEETWQRLLARTAELRGLPAQAEISRSVLSREQLHARLADQLGDARTAEQLAETARLYQLLGLLPPGADLRALIQRFRGDGVDGFYDARTGEVYVVSDADELTAVDRIVAVHEYTHALQYQHFNLRGQRQATSSNADRSLALTTLLEGDASWMMIRYMLADFSQDEVQALLRQALGEAGSASSRLSGVPRVLRETTMFPYTDGVTFLMQVLGRDALRGDDYGEAVNQLFADPPQSTAQILHPERYRRGQAPAEVRLGDAESALGAGWHELDRGVLGELYHRVLLEEHLRPPTSAYLDDEDDCYVDDECCYDDDDDSCDDYYDDNIYQLWPEVRARRAAEGWAGDGYTYLENDDGAGALLLRTRWDDATEAGEWFEAYTAAMQDRYGEALVTVEDVPGHHLWRTPDGALVLDSTGADTVLALAPTAAQARQLAAVPLEP